LESLILIPCLYHAGYGYSEPYPNTEYSSSQVEVVKALEQPLRDSSSAPSRDLALTTQAQPKPKKKERGRSGGGKGEGLLEDALFDPLPASLPDSLQANFEREAFKGQKRSPNPTGSFSQLLALSVEKGS
jgi:hypothetical protein